MHIVLVSREFIPTLRGGGIASYIKEMATSYQEKGHEVTVICASDDTRMESDIQENGIRVIRLSGGDFIIPTIEKDSILKKFRCIYRFHSYRKKIQQAILLLENVDVIEAPEYGAEGFYLKTCMYPVVIRLHTPTFLDRKTSGKKIFKKSQFYTHWCAKQEVKTLKKFNYITSCSESLKNWVEEYFHINQSKIKVIYNPINAELWNSSSEDVTIFRESGSILFVGTVAEEKGVGDLIEACKIVLQKGYKIQLTIAGKLGKYGNHLKENALKNDLTWCNFLGNLPRNELYQLYQENLIACFPSWWEGMGIVCTEAMTSGCIVIGSSSGGMSEIINDGQDGFLIVPQNPDVLANKIIQVLEMDEERKKSIRHCARQKVINRFSTDGIVKQMLDYYQEVITHYQSLQ